MVINASDIYKNLIRSLIIEVIKNDSELFKLKTTQSRVVKYIQAIEHLTDPIVLHKGT